jgi:dual specificity protein kinase YAK1
MPQTKTARQGHEVEKGAPVVVLYLRKVLIPRAELNNRASFVDFCQGLLNLNPVTRWTPQQARLHPFITGEKFTKPFVVRLPLNLLSLP